MDACKQSEMDDCKQNNTRRGVQVGGSRPEKEGGGDGLRKRRREYKVRMEEFQCELPSDLFFEAPISGRAALSRFLLSWSVLEGEREWKSPWLVGFLRDGGEIPQGSSTQKTDGPWDPPYLSLSFSSSSFGTTCRTQSRGAGWEQYLRAAWDTCFSVLSG